MKAVVCTTLGEPNLLEIQDNPIPEPQKNEVLIKVEAAGVNFPDALMVQGKYQIVMDPPFTPGTEVCGIVEGIGEDVEIKIGTKVIALPPMGGFVCAVGSDEKEEYVKSLGADQIIRYDQVDLKETTKELTNGKGVDVVMDPVGGNVTEQALRATAWNGRLLVIGFTDGNIPRIPLNLTLVKGVSIVGVWWGRWTTTSPEETAEDFGELLSFIEKGELNIEPKNVHTIEETPLALENFLSRKNIGKTVISF